MISLLIFRIFLLQIDISGRLTYIWLVSIYIHSFIVPTASQTLYYFYSGWGLSRNFGIFEMQTKMKEILRK